MERIRFIEFSIRDHNGKLVNPLKLLREEFDLTQKQMETKIGINSFGACVGHMEQGHRTISRKRMRKLAETFNFDGMSFMEAYNAWYAEFKESK